MNTNFYNLLLEMAKINPETKEILTLIQTGQNPEKIFRDLCAKKGVDPDEFIKKLGNIR